MEPHHILRKILRSSINPPTILLLKKELSESADSPMPEIDDEKSGSMVSEMTCENISQPKADQGLKNVLP